MAGIYPADDAPGERVELEDLSRSIAIIDQIPYGIMDPRDGLTDQASYDRFVHGWREDIAATLGSFAVKGQPFPPSADLYPVGAQANGIEHVVFYIAEIGNDLIQAADAYIGLGQLLIDLFCLRHRRLVAESESPDQANHLMGSVTVTQAMVEAMCEAHARSHFYDPKRHPAFQSVSLAHESIFGSEQHPTYQVTYTVAVNIGPRTYVYYCLPSGQVGSLLRIESGQTEVLEAPDLFGTRSSFG